MRVFDVAYIKCKEKKKDWRKNKAVFIFNLFCFVKGKTKTVCAPFYWNCSFLSLEYIIKNFHLFACKTLSFAGGFWINASKLLVGSHIGLTTRERKEEANTSWSMMHIEINYFFSVLVVSVRLFVCIHGWNHWNHEHYDNFHRGKVAKRNANNSLQNHSTLTILSSASYDCVLFFFFSDYFHITLYEQPKVSFSLILQFVNAV